MFVHWFATAHYTVQYSTGFCFSVLLAHLKLNKEFIIKMQVYLQYTGYIIICMGDSKILTTHIHVSCVA